VCHGFRLTNHDYYYWVNFAHFLIKRHFYRQLGQCKLVRAWNQTTRIHFSLPKSVKRSACSTKSLKVKVNFFQTVNNIEIEIIILFSILHFLKTYLHILHHNIVKSKSIIQTLSHSSHSCCTYCHLDNICLKKVSDCNN